MADTMSSEQRSRCMAAIRSKDTKPEMVVRRYLFGKGLRFRIHVKTLPGHPDIVLPKFKTVIFVNGCFWHGHEGCRYSNLPSSNSDFWIAKISRNKERDASQEEALCALGWRVIRVWECEIKRIPDREARLARLYEEILDKEEINPLPQDVAFAADPEASYGKS